MARERTQNGGVTFLNGALNDSATTVPVADASFLSSVPQYRIILDAEIMLVTGISGNNLTVIRGVEGSTASSHSDGATIAQIMTKEGIQRYMQDWTNPFFDVTAGFPYQLLDSTGASLITTDFAWTNQGSAADATQANAGILFTIDSTASDSVRLYLRTLTAPWKVTCAFTHLWLGGTTPGVGMCIVDNTAGNFKAWGNEGVADYKRDRWTNTTTNASTQQTFSSLGSRSKIWLQLEDDNVDHFFRISIDGINFVTVAQETRTTHTTTPDRVGMFFNNLNTGQDMVVDLHSWIEE